MAEPADKATLVTQTIDWLVVTGLLNTIAERESMLSLAGFDDHLKGQIEREGSPRVFSSRLLNLLLNYEPLSEGKLSLTNFLTAVGSSLGIDNQELMQGLINDINAYIPSPDPISGRDDREHITLAERPSLWIGVPDLPRYGLVGRDPLLKDLITRLTAGEHVSLSTLGKGGVGKTALAVAVAYNRQLLAHFRDGVLWASVGLEGDPMLELGRWAEKLGRKPQEYPQPGVLKEAVKGVIGQRRLLLIIDDVWNPDHADLLRCGGPNCAHLLTSRKTGIARRFAGGQENALDVPDLKEDPAFALLKRIAPEACAVDEAAARELVRQVGGLPLAVELLGGYLTKGGAPDPILFPELSQERLADLADPVLRLRQAQARLGSVAAEDESLQEVIGLSLENLSHEEKAAYYALGAFAPKPAAFIREAAEAVSHADGALLNQLVNTNMLEIGGGAFTLHQVLASLALERMDNEAQVRHAAYYLELVNVDCTDWQRIDAVYEQIRWAWERVDDDACLDWVHALRQHQVTRGYWKESIEWQKRGLTWARARDEREDEAALLNNLAWTYDDLGRRTEALRLYEEALPILRQVGDRNGEAVTLNNMGEVYLATGRPSEALQLFEEALSIIHEEGNRAEEATTLNNMGAVYQATGRPAEALRLYEEVLPIRREVEDRTGEAATLNNVAEVHYTAGRLAEALQRLEAGLTIRREEGDRAGEAMTLNNIGEVYRATGRLKEALALYEDVLSIRREMEDRTGEATTLNNMGGVSRATGQLAEALAFYEEALPIRCEVEDRAGEAMTLNNIGEVYRAMGRPDDALRLLEEALLIMREVESRKGEATTLGNKASVYKAMGRLEEALRLYEETLPIMREVENRTGEATTLNNIGEMYRAMGRPEDAMRMYKEALPIMGEVGNRGGEATTLANLAQLLAQMKSMPEAIERLEKAIAVMRDSGLTHDAGGVSLAQREALLEKWQSG